MKPSNQAFIPGEKLFVAGASRGSLAGSVFAAKDLFDVVGEVTGCGNPDWKATHDPAQSTAPAILALLGAGADLCGKTITDELAFSLEGRNAHYGSPPNPVAPSRIPGGSSSGSASAVAAGAVDFALGTDTGGSVRVPAALCGLYGLRPTHGAVSLTGVMPLAPSFDTVGWLAREASLLRRVGDVLLPRSQECVLEHILLVEDLESISDPEVADSFRRAMHRLSRTRGRFETLSIEARTELSPAAWTQVFRTLQGHEIAAMHGAWIDSAKPVFDPEIALRFEWARSVTDAAASAAAPQRERFALRIDKQLEKGTVLCLPATPTVAPELAACDEVYHEYRRRTLIATAIAGLAGCPQVTLPIPSHLRSTGLPVGLSLIASRGSDRALLNLAVRLAIELEESA